MDLESKSRTQKKRDAKNLQELGKRLIKLPLHQLSQIDLPEEILEAVEFARTITKHGAYRRQVLHLGALLRTIDPEPAYKVVESFEFGNAQTSGHLKKIERWRDELVAGNDALIEDIINECPATNRQRLAQLVRNARKELVKQQSPKPSRALFRYLRQITMSDEPPTQGRGNAQKVQS